MTLKLRFMTFAFGLLLAVAVTMPSVAPSAPVQECWRCWTDPDPHEEYGTVHWDDQGGFVRVEPPDFEHVSLGVDSCTDGLNPAAHTYTDQCPLDDDDDGDSLAFLARALRSSQATH